MAVLLKVYAKFGACNRAPRFSPRAKKKYTARADTQFFCDPLSRNPWQKEPVYPPTDEASDEVAELQRAAFSSYGDADSAEGFAAAQKLNGGGVAMKRQYGLI